MLLVQAPRRRSYNIPLRTYKGLHRDGLDVCPLPQCFHYTRLRHVLQEGLGILRWGWISGRSPQHMLSMQRKEGTKGR